NKLRTQLSRLFLMNTFIIFTCFSDGPENVQIKGPNKVNIKGTLKLTCSAESTPSARFTWFLNGTEILTNSAEYIKEEVELSDSGNYTCQAWNNITERTSSSVVHGLTWLKKPGSTNDRIRCVVVTGQFKM
uniref:Ig-like domain-containing protein n=1 Tax=Neolamprologus brichardi TaxID=32507 RepID=A0A3Q4HY59_NEOBR